MRRLKDIWDDYTGVVDFYALETDSWPMGRATRRALSELGIRVHAAKVAFDASGTIVYRAGFAQGDAATWRGVFDDLAGR